MLKLTAIVLASFVFSLIFARRASASDENVRITVKVPPNTPANGKVYISGNHPALGGWKPGVVPMKNEGNGVFSFSARIAGYRKLQFKFTRGDFAKIEKDSGGWDIENRVLYVVPSKFNETRCVVEMWGDMIPSNSSYNNYTLELVGRHKMFKRMRSKFLDFPRNVAVLLPRSYYDSDCRQRRYPVLYMHDGNNLFDPNVSFSNCDWGVDEAVDRLTAAGEIKEIIVVGVYNTPARTEEYTPYCDPEEGGGRGDDYGRFLVEELKPFIDKNFRTMTGPEETGIGGSSLGGLISLYLGIKYPGVFKKILSVSPTLWWGEAAIFDWTLGHDLTDENCRIWMDMGLAEDEKEIWHSRKLDKLIRRRFPKLRSYTYREYNRAGHNEYAWRRRFQQMLRYMYGTDIA